MKRKPDHYYRRAQRQGYAARSVFKLAELDRKYGLIKPKMAVLDLGAAPGSWLQYLTERVGEKGVIVGVDIAELRIALPGYVHFRQRDVLTLEPEELREFAPRFHLILSDMAPKTTGDQAGDSYRSYELCRRAWHLAEALLKPGGNFLAKMLQGEDTPNFLALLRSHFRQVKTQKPSASRSPSREIFVLGLKFGS